MTNSEDPDVFMNGELSDLGLRKKWTVLPRSDFNQIELTFAFSIMSSPDWES